MCSVKFIHERTRNFRKGRSFGHMAIKWVHFIKQSQNVSMFDSSFSVVADLGCHLV